MNTYREEPIFNHQLIKVNGASVHVVEAGNRNGPGILFLHGYPENWQAFEGIMHALKNDYRLLAVDLPGVGLSDPIEAGDKLTIARFIRALADVLKIGQFTLVGHDIGGMITYSFLKNFPEYLFRAVIMDTAVPGIEPWEAVKKNPHIWHFAFFAVPSLPEILISGKQAALFDFFYDSLSADKATITHMQRQSYAAAYEKETALKASLDWYRAFPQDEKDNAEVAPVNVPVLYIRGDKEYGDITAYTVGFCKKGIRNIKHELIPACGHFAPEEQALKVANTIAAFAGS